MIGRNRWGTTRWGAGGSASTGAEGMSVAIVLPDLIYRLGFTGEGEVTSTAWVTMTELYQWADEAAQRLARDTGAFLAWDTSINTGAETAVYALPSYHVYTLAAWFSAVPLRITRVQDLFALDGNAMSTECQPGSAPTRVSYDAGSVGTATLYPIPGTNGTLKQIMEEVPPTVAAATPTVPLCAIAQDYFLYAMLAGARGKESEGAMPEMLPHFQKRLALLEQLFEHLWGPGQ